MFGITGLLTAVGALGPAAVAIIAPIALGFAARYKINVLLMGMMVIHGAQAGGFSPISVYGVTVNSITADAGLVDSPLALFLGSLLFNAAIGVVLFVFLGGRSLIGQHVDDHDREVSEAGGATSPSSGPVGKNGANGTNSGSAPATGGSAAATKSRAETTPDTPTVTFEQIATLVGLAALALFALVLDLDVGFVSMTVAVVLALLSPKTQKGAIAQISWSTVLLIGGVLTFIGVLQEAGTVDYVGNAVAGLGIPCSSHCCCATSEGSSRPSPPRRRFSVRRFRSRCPSCSPEK